MHAQTTQDRQPQSGCNRYRSGPVSVFLPVAQPDFKSLDMTRVDDPQNPIQDPVADSDFPITV
jgi:hypothetical protein